MNTITYTTITESGKIINHVIPKDDSIHNYLEADEKTRLIDRLYAKHIYNHLSVTLVKTRNRKIKAIIDSD